MPSKPVSSRFHFALIAVLSFLLGSTQMPCLWPAGKIVINALAYGDPTNPEGRAWMRIVERFEDENPDVDIRYELLYDEAYHNRVASLLRKGGDAVPDLAYMGSDVRWGTPWKEAGQQFDHRAFLDGDYYDLSLIPAMGPSGEIYLIPMGTSNMVTVLFMNEALVSSLGFKPPKTYQDMAAMVSKARLRNLDVVSIDGADSWAWGSCLFSCIVARMTGDPHWVSKAVAGEKKFTDPGFVAALAMVETMVKDGVISRGSLFVDYGTNLSNFNKKRALFMVQGQWAGGSIEEAVQEKTRMLAWPAFPGEKPATAGSVAAAVSVGYGLTKKGGSNPAVREAALKFLREYYYAKSEVTQRLREGAIVAPILKNCALPEDLPRIVKQKVELSRTALTTEVIDTVLSGKPNDALNAGIRSIVAGEATPEQVALKIEELLRGKHEYF